MSQRAVSIARVFAFAVSVVLFVGTAFLVVRDIPKTAGDALEELSVCFEKRLLEFKGDTRCLSEKVVRLVNMYRTEDLMRSVYAEPKSVVGINCHIISHYIGEYTYKREGTLEGTLSKCTSDCRNGCTHGAVGAAVLSELGLFYEGDDIAHADTKRMGDLGKEYCGKSVVLCHGIGHLAFIIGGLDGGLRVCDEVGVHQHECGMGVYMEGVVSLELLSEGRSKVGTARYAYPCTAAPLKYKGPCFVQLPKYQNNIFAEENVTTYQEQLSIRRRTCESFTPDDRVLCFFGMGSYVYQMYEESGRRVDESTFCDQFETDSDKGACALGIVRSYITASPPKYSEALSYCARVSNKNACFIGAFTFKASLDKTSTSIPCPPRAHPLCSSYETSYLKEEALLPAEYEVIFKQ